MTGLVRVAIATVAGSSSPTTSIPGWYPDKAPCAGEIRGVTGRDIIANPGCGAIVGRRLSLEDTRNEAPGPSSNSISRGFHIPTWREPRRAHDVARPGNDRCRRPLRQLRHDGNLLGHRQAER